MATEHEDLDQLLHSQGWLRFQQFAAKEWGDQLEQQLRQAAAEREDTMAANKIRQILVAKAAVERLVKWPADRLAELDRAEQSRLTGEHIPLSRRGTL